MMSVASAELSVPALQETPISQTSGTHLKLYAPESEMHLLIEDRGIARSGVQFAMDVTRHEAQLTFEYLTSADGQTWNIKNSETIDVSEDADVHALIEDRRKRYDDCINWDATGI